MAEYSQRISTLLPRLPLEGNIDLTYRCNNTCQHCWLWLSPRAHQQADELTFSEICQIADEARAMGTRRWNISGGEPMLRPDFPEIFDYLTAKSSGYSLNTNGTLITPEIARLMTRKGSKMVALYGATPEVYDTVTRNPGGFELLMQGIEMLKQAGAGFIMQLIPMRQNWHEWDAMIRLARSLTSHYRLGAPWLYLSANGDPRRRAEIADQRLPPREALLLDPPQLPDDLPPQLGSALAMGETALMPSCGIPEASDDRLFARCIAGRKEFHIDPYGGMTFCTFIKHPDLRYDLRRGSFRQAWEEFIPSLADMVRGGDEFRQNCGSCDRREDCRWCAVYSYLETGRFTAPVPYLCAVAEETRKYKEEWPVLHRRYFRIAGITVRVESDLDFFEYPFKPEFSAFAVEGPGEDMVTLRHHFYLPELQEKDLGEEVYHRVPWSIWRKNGSWFYLGISDGVQAGLHRVAQFSADYSRGVIFSPPRDIELLQRTGWNSISMFPTDQIWLAPLLADRQAVLIHSAGLVVNGAGLAFIGHSSAGKSTTVTLLKDAAGIGEAPPQVEILCDDRNILRRWEDGWRIHGTWSHGTVSDVSNGAAPLCAILFIEQSPCNEILPIVDRKEIWKRLLATLIRPMATPEWWQKELDILQKVVDEVPCYLMRFDKSGAIVKELLRLVKDVRGLQDIESSTAELGVG